MYRAWSRWCSSILALLYFPFAAMVTDLRAGQSIALRDTGDLAFAIRASCCLPALHVPVRDPDGRLLGHFIPASDPSTDPRLMPHIREEELQRREEAGGGRSLASILADLTSKG